MILKKQLTKVLLGRQRVYFLHHLAPFVQPRVYPIRDLHCSPMLCVVPKNLKGKGKPAQDWLTRQLNDPYVKKSRYENYRARSAYKLIEIDAKYSILKPGMSIVDCGAAPGSWTQVAVQRVNADGKMEGCKRFLQGTVIALDIIPFEPVQHAICLPEMNIFSEECTEKLASIMMARSGSNDFNKSSFVDVVLSDMCPSASGHKEIDHDNVIKLCYAALKFTVLHLVTGGTFLCKIWRGRRETDLCQDLKNLFENVRYVKPPASRDDSAEIYLLAQNFRGIENKYESPFNKQTRSSGSVGTKIVL